MDEFRTGRFAHRPDRGVLRTNALDLGVLANRYEPLFTFLFPFFPIFRWDTETEMHGLPIETASLALRAFVPEDAPKVFQMSQEDGMRTWLPSQVYRDGAHAASVLASLISQYSVPGDPRIGPYVLGVQVRSAGELVGHVGFGPLGETVEVGFAIERVHQRKGIATEAVRIACEWAADAFSIATIFGVTAAQNSASQGVLLRAGFARQKEEVMRFQGLEQPIIYFAFARRH